MVKNFMFLSTFSTDNVSTEVGGWSKKGKIMSTWFLNDPQLGWIPVNDGKSCSNTLPLNSISCSCEGINTQFMMFQEIYKKFH